MFIRNIIILRSTFSTTASTTTTAATTTTSTTMPTTMSLNDGLMKFWTFGKTDWDWSPDPRWRWTCQCHIIVLRTCRQAREKRKKLFKIELYYCNLHRTHGWLENLWYYNLFDTCKKNNSKSWNILKKIKIFITFLKEKMDVENQKWHYNGNVRSLILL